MFLFHWSVITQKLGEQLCIEFDVFPWAFLLSYIGLYCSVLYSAEFLKLLFNFEPWALIITLDIS